MDFNAIREAAAKAKQRNASGEQRKNGKRVILQTMVTVRSKVDEAKKEKYIEYILEDGSVVRELLQVVEKTQMEQDMEQGISPCIPFVFRQGRWEKLYEDSAALTAESDVPDKLVVITYNVWFSPLNQRARAQVLLDICQKFDADVICFQEATRAFLQVLTLSDWVRERYFISDCVGSTFLGQDFPYGVVMLVKHRLGYPTMRLYSMPSNMNRRPLFCELFSGKLRIVTVHLESEKEAALRASQQSFIFGLLEEQREDSVLDVFCGDFNYDPLTSVEEIKQVPKDFVDSWLENQEDMDNPGVTFPFDEENVESPGKRIDRVLYRSSTFHTSRFELLGTDVLDVLPELEDTDLPSASLSLQEHLRNASRRPSDHFGILVLFSSMG